MLQPLDVSTRAPTHLALENAWGGALDQSAAQAADITPNENGLGAGRGPLFPGLHRVQAPKRCTPAMHRGISARAVCATRWRSSANPGALATAAAQTRFFRARRARRAGVRAAPGTRGRFRLRCFAQPRWRCQRITSREIGHAPGSGPRNARLSAFWSGKGGFKQCPVPDRPTRARISCYRG